MGKVVRVPDEFSKEINRVKMLYYKKFGVVITDKEAARKIAERSKRITKLVGF